MEWIYKPWPWYVSGPLIALFMFTMLFIGRRFGMSSNLRTVCTMAGADRWSDYFKLDWRKQRWNLSVMTGAILGGWFSSQYLSYNTVEIADRAVRNLETYGIESSGNAYLPTELFGTSQFFEPTSLLLLAGGFLVGFGARYAGGCTSGHGISGISNLQKASLVSTIGFFIGGIIMVQLIFPIIF